MDNIGSTYTFIDIIRNRGITFIKVAKYTGQDRAKYVIIANNGQSMTLLGIPRIIHYDSTSK